MGKNTTAYVAGERGHVVDFKKDATGRYHVGAFVRLALRPAMLYVSLGKASAETPRWRPVESAVEIDREEFDRLTGLAALRRDMGWDIAA